MKRKRVCKTLLLRFSFLLLLLSSSVLFAQNKTVTGIVKDEKGQPMQGVSVLLKGSSSGTNTAANGSFSIMAPDNGVLVFSSVGFATREISVNGRQRLEIELTSQTASVGEVIVV
ncbi:MAG TPA: carboxypeptidase-like regulatory domain-containing protein, partial [Panacibacter sp.]|nr:carboxypeptidase-like regulatory domain-containing protein [Panacibacter sp.]